MTDSKDYGSSRLSSRGVPACNQDYSEGGEGPGSITNAHMGVDPLYGRVHLAVHEQVYGEGEAEATDTRTH